MMKAKWMAMGKHGVGFRQRISWRAARSRRQAWVCLLSVWLLVLLAACRSSENATPTPFPLTPGEIAPPAGLAVVTPIPATVADILANPEFFEGATVRLTGQYLRRPLLVCGLDPHPSPAEWTLLEGENELAGAGFGSQLRRLWPNGMTFTVIGRLTHFRGPVGCGKQAVPREFWYLDAVKIVEPSQLALVTLTPGGLEGSVPAEMFTPVTEVDTPDPTGGVVPVTAPPTAPPTNTPSATPVAIETLSTGFTPVATTTPTPISNGTIVSGTETAVATPADSSTTPTITPTGAFRQGTPTPSMTPRPGTTATPTTAAGSTAIPTATLTGANITDMGEDLVVFDYRVRELASSEIHSWGLALDVDDDVAVAALGDPGVNVAVAVLDEANNTVAEQNTAGSGETEMLTFTATVAGNYKLQIKAANGQTGAYLLVLGNETFPLLPQRFLTYGDVDGSTIFVDELHYWFFRGERDDVVNVVLDSPPDANLLVSLYDSDGRIVSDLFYLEEIADFSLPRTDYYILELEEWGVDENQYQITLTGQ